MDDREARLSHLDSAGEARMVDVGSKAITERGAEARGLVVMLPDTLRLVRENVLAKGDVLAVARVAGIMAAKRTADLIPLCHPLPLTSVEVDFRFDGDSAIEVIGRAQTTDRTGVEMEALTAVTVAGLTIYDMCKAVDRTIQLTAVRLTWKAGGRSGEYRAG